LKVTATFVRSVADANGLPRDGLGELAVVGRSNVGKSSLINALIRQRLARTSAAPGKTRLANIYRVTRDGAPSFYLVDLPGYGFARGRDAARAFDDVTRAYFSQQGRDRRDRQDRQDRQEGKGPPAHPAFPAHPAPPAQRSALLLVDARHPGLENDRTAWTWLLDTVDQAAIVATKIDKLARGERIRALREFESVYERPVLPVSAVTGEGLDDLWKLIDKSLPPK
jgi:GTP-binding protein